jgi:polyisoprenoid-binding protein YceI
MAKWVIDPDHSVAAFVIKHMMVTNVRGQFNKLNGTIEFNPAEIVKSSVEVSIDVSGIYTGIQKRDDHLRSPDFFDSKKYPMITFKSTNIENIIKNRFNVIGNLTIRGISKQIILNVEYSGPEKSPFGETSMGFFATTHIKCEDYGLLWNMPLESGGFMIGKDTHITLDIEADLAFE